MSEFACPSKDEVGANIWFVPLVDAVNKINVDAAIFAEDKMTGLGALIRDHSGQLLVTATTCMMR